MRSPERSPLMSEILGNKKSKDNVSVNATYTYF